ncbi:MAG TPA: tRNA (guanosine(37)-N1)-methyltransferase TrmD [Campylobacterales bacterium]|nr:tRNA (guanosine(37)-N1)-methyltransferase TrmD [Campylobacterales bacterium]
MKFTFVTLFSSLCQGYFSDSILKRAIDKKYIEIDYLSPRDFTTNKHKKVDDYQIGGGAGLTLMTQPLDSLICDIKEKNSDAHVIFVLPSAKPFRQIDAMRLASKKHIVLVSGRYEGFDERSIEMLADEVFSVGDFILTGGELPSLCICDSISRQVDGVLGNSDSLSGESFENNLLEAPGFTKPNIFKNTEVTKEYLSGNHKKINQIKKELAKYKTKFFRPDLFEKVKVLVDKN